MKSRLKCKPASLMILSAALCFSTAAFGQDTNAAGTTPANNQAANKAPGGSTQDQYPDIVEIDPFGGISTYGQVQRGLDTKMLDGWVYGFRATVNPTKYFGLEFWGDLARAYVHFRLPSNGGVYPVTAPANLVGTPIPTYSFHNANWYLGLNPVLNLKPRGSKVQPYLTIGIDVVQFTPTSSAEAIARNPTINSEFYSGNLNDNLQVGFNYGGGVKFHLTDHFGLRIDARGTWSRNPTFDLPNYPDGGIYIPSRDHVLGFQGTIGLVWYFGQGKCPPMPAAPPAPAPLPTPTITGGEGTICQGKPVTLHANITGPTGHTLTYAWTVNGQTQGGNTADLTFTPNNTGSMNVQVTVTDTTPAPAPLMRPKNFPERCWVQPPAPQPVAPVTATTTLTVSDTAPQIASVTASPNELACSANQNGTHTANLSANVTPSPCGGNLTYKWTVSEGSVSNDTSPNATFDASTVNFQGGAQGQSKTITATLTVTDETGKTATQSTNITVNCQPQFVRLDDVIYAKNNARVNNCGKRVLIDDAAPKVAGGDYDIVLVGHRDTDEEANVREAARGRRGRNRRAAERPLDEQRVLNAAAVLSGGTGTCAKVDPARIRVDWVGTDQTSDTRPGLCGTSNRASQKERRGSRVSEADKNRRVEVYLVPSGSQTLPPAVKNIKPLPEREVKALGCPR